MIELQALNNILTNNNLDEYLNQGVSEKYFIDYKREFRFILNHYNTYDKVPDLATFLVEFSNFELIDVLEPTSFIIKNLIEEYLFEEGVKLFDESAELLNENSFKGLSNILTKAQKLLESNSQSEAVNINKLREDKLKQIEEKKKKGGMVGISSGLKELDELTGGWMPGEELVTIVGRVNQGKSWLLQKFLSSANDQGHTVLLYSGEMSVFQVAYRSDTLSYNISNRSITRGTIEDEKLEEYSKQLEDAENKAPYYVFTPKDLGGEYLSVSRLKALIKKYKPDIVGIDQISLMQDDLKGENKRIQLGNISAGLFQLSEEFGIPILIDAQANRNKADVDNPKNPDLSDIAESDAIGQNSSRMISLVQTTLGLSLGLMKNRHGDNNKKLIYAWNIDIGDFQFTGNGDDVKPLEFRNKKKEEGEPSDVF